PEFGGRDTYRLGEDREGTIWASGYEPSNARVCAIQRSGVRCYGEKGEFGNGVGAFHEDRNGNLWMSNRGAVWRWKPGPPRFYPIPGQASGVEDFAEDDNGALLLGASGQILRFADGKLDPFPLPGVSLHSQVRSLLRDREGSIWIGTLRDGLLHF